MVNLFHNPQWLDIAPVNGIPDEYELWNPEKMTFSLAPNDLYLPSGGNKIIVESPKETLMCGLMTPREEGGGENWLNVAHHNFYDIDFYFNLIHGHFSFEFDLYYNDIYETYYEALFVDNTHYWWVWEDYYAEVHESLKTCPSGYFTERIYTQAKYWQEELGLINKLVAYWFADYDPVSFLGEDSHFEAAYPVLTAVIDEDYAFVT